MNQAESYALAGDFPLAPMLTFLPPEDYVAAVCNLMHVSAEDVTGSRRTAHIAAARMLAMYLIREHLRLSTPKIGLLFHRDHATVVHACQVIARRIQAQPGFGRLVGELMRSV